jgi:hypothetical protein
MLLGVGRQAFFILSRSGGADGLDGIHSVYYRNWMIRHIMNETHIAEVAESCMNHDGSMCLLSKSTLCFVNNYTCIVLY